MHMTWEIAVKMQMTQENGDRPAFFRRCRTQENSSRNVQNVRITKKNKVEQKKTKKKHASNKLYFMPTKESICAM